MEGAIYRIVNNNNKNHFSHYTEYLSPWGLVACLLVLTHGALKILLCPYFVLMLTLQGTLSQ